MFSVFVSRKVDHRLACFRQFGIIFKACHCLFSSAGYPKFMKYFPINSLFFLSALWVCRWAVSVNRFFISIFRMNVLFDERIEYFRWHWLLWFHFVGEFLFFNWRPPERHWMGCHTQRRHVGPFIFPPQSTDSTRSFQRFDPVVPDFPGFE